MEKSIGYIEKSACVVTVWCEQLWSHVRVKDNLKREFGNRSWRESELLKLEITIGGFGDGDLNVWVLY